MSTQTKKKTKSVKKAPSPRKKKPAAKGAFLKKAQQAVQDENWQDLEAACNEYLETNKECLETHFIKSILAYFQDDIRLAIDLAEEALKFDDACDEIADTLATYYALGGDLFNSV